jgi:hypothetical protein
VDIVDGIPIWRRKFAGEAGSSIGVGEVVCDVAIESGNAISVPLDKQAVNEAMSLVKAYHPQLIFTFHSLLATQAQAQGGWYIFLAAAARKFAGYWSGGDIELEE